MLIRPFAPNDAEIFRQIHAESGLDYAFPNLKSPLFIAKMVVERAGRPTTLLTGRIEAETYLLTSGSPRDRWEDIQAVQESYLSELWAQGIDSTYCAVPPEINRLFGKRMLSLGWEPARDWHIWTRPTVV